MTITIVEARANLDWQAISRASAHPIQVAVLELLARDSECRDDTLSPNAMARELGQPLGVVSYHVRMLAQRGLITLARTEPKRGALAHFYRLADRATA